MKSQRLNDFFWQSLILLTASVVGFTIKPLRVTALPIIRAEIPDTNQQLLPIQKNINSVASARKIRSLNQIEHPLGNAQKLVQSSTPTPRTQVIQVTGVKVNSTDKGLEVILETSAKSERLQVTPKTEGNAYIADIPNAQLRLSSGESFHQQKPVVGMTEVSVTNINTNHIRLTVTGETLAPAVELFDSAQGLVFGVTSTATTGQQSKTPPQQTKPRENPGIEIDVTASPDTYRVNNTSVGTKTDTPLRDIPQTVNVIPRQVIEDQASQNLGDVLRNLGIGNSQNTSRVTDSALIRGFEIRPDNGTLKNGLKDPEAGRAFGTNLNNIERVEVLKGPASVLYGQLPPGGAINLVTKQPLSDPYYSVGFKIGSYSEYEPSFDFSGPLTADRSLLYRFNASYKNSSSFVDFQNIERIFIAPVITWQPSSNTKLTIEGDYQTHIAHFNLKYKKIQNRENQESQDN